MRLFVLEGPCAEKLKGQITNAIVTRDNTEIESYSDTIMICVVGQLPKQRKSDLIIFPSFAQWCDCTGGHHCRAAVRSHGAVMMQLIAKVEDRRNVLFTSADCHDEFKFERLIADIHTHIASHENVMCQ
jgi:hypothetical protein